MISIQPPAAPPPAHARISPVCVPAPAPPQNVVFPYPDVWVCLYVNYGCDEWELEEDCMRSSNATQGGATGAVFYPGGEYEQEIPAVPRITPNVSKRFKGGFVGKEASWSRSAGSDFCVRVQFCWNTQDTRDLREDVRTSEKGEITAA